ncbi:hypothetical protein SAMN04488115_107307 [Bosea lathyri]|uniref:Uncharacterized protein n=1 Tax=Bosea lathyri TaxID=1036778 RepID=A0A1H6BK39_9HYPH|nr:hypothetical protein SAMN04488115_107307 [Bosea lathyri]
MTETEPPSEGEGSLPLHLRMAIRICYPNRAEAEGYEDCVLRLTATTLASRGPRAAKVRMYKETFLACGPTLARLAKKIVIWLIFR